jgi:hypothetical protein
MRKLLALLTILPICCEAQQIGNGVLNIYKSVGMVSYMPTPTNKSYGTGTLIRKIHNDSMMSVFLITCKHVLPTFNQSRTVFFDITDKGSSTKFSTFSIELYDSIGNLNKMIKYDPDGNDLAVINVTYFFFDNRFTEINRNIMPYELLLPKDSIEANDVKVGDDILFAGYPNGWYDQRNKSPIVRSGIISSPPEEDFYFSDLFRIAYQNKYHTSLPQKLNGFLIDANAVGGSSGSLVFLKPVGYRIHNGQLEYSAIGGVPSILGILTYSYPDPNAVSEKLRLNIGGVISASSIRKTISSFNLR